MKGGGIDNYFKCAFSDSYYTQISTYNGLPLLTEACPDDDNFYQVCGFVGADRMQITDGQFYCGGFICGMDLGYRRQVMTIKLLSELNKSTQCYGEVSFQCSNTAFDDTLCAEVGQERIYMVSGQDIEKSFLCDDTCDDRDHNCEDEANCNGFQYGLYCNNMWHPLKLLSYVLVHYICDGSQFCENGEDEDDCSTDEVTRHSCLVSESFAINPSQPLTVPLTNRTRCAVFERNNLLGFNQTYCQNFMDQTNCSDWARVGVTCKINNFTSTVSKYMVCAMATTLCDDGMENICLDVSLYCNVHKHRLCDGIVDCLDKGDENSRLCLEMTERTCLRTALTDGTRRKIPLAWLQDGIVDCMDGRDELPIWPTCGLHDTQRFVAKNNADTCENVFLCPKAGFVKYEDLCDGFESCGVENNVCKVSRGYADIQTTTISFVAASQSRITFKLSYCQKGIEDVLLLQNRYCYGMPYRYASGEIFGVPEKNMVYLPSVPQNCDHLYGENYLLNSCTGNCISSTCPLKTLPRYEHCPGQIFNRVGTLVSSNYMTFLTKLKGVYHNNYFICAESKKCLEYSKVCDLVEDCADGSDEAECTNHFKCGNTKHYIPITRKCDGTIDCLDTSDECNESCSKQLLTSRFMRASSWLMGVLAFIGNSMVILTEARLITQCETIAGLSNKCFIILIALGDLLMGIYLMWLTLTDTFVFGHGADYCRQQWSWLTSLNCSILGVLSTAGTLISLFSMCTLSVSRAFRFRSGIKISREVTMVGTMKLMLQILMVLTVSLTLAGVPLVNYFDDFFVNGMHYDPRMKLFIRFSDKDQHFKILQEYHGRMKKAPISWRMVNKMVSDIFSHDLDYEDLPSSRKALHFYGNDAVCLFKYFVRADDPQKVYVWSVLFTNLVCFIIIAACYIYINFLCLNSARKSGRRLESKQERTQWKIALIISTDFICWLPFITICFLHSLQVLDGSKWYSFFSMVILPLNSVINPMLYSGAVTRFFIRVCKMICNLASKCKCKRSDVQTEDIEMQDLNLKQKDKVELEMTSNNTVTQLTDTRLMAISTSEQ